jgi:hypothetical protein
MSLSLKELKSLRRGDKVSIVGNSIFDMMGLRKVTGTIYLLRDDHSGCSFQCRETRAIETADFDDGEWEIEGK